MPDACAGWGASIFGYLGRDEDGVSEKVDSLDLSDSPICYVVEP